MKQLFTTLLILTCMVGMGQTIDLKKLYEQYIKYCNEEVTDTIEEYGELSTTKEVPIYGPCDEIIGYREVTTGDTTWKGYKCKQYMNERNYLISGGDRVLTWRADTLSWVTTVKSVSCKVTRKHICQVKREKPSSEGFYQWLYKEIAK